MSSVVDIDAGVHNGSCSQTAWCPEKTHERLQDVGFVKLPGLFDRNEVSVLQEHAQRLLAGDKQPWSQFAKFSREGRWQSTLIGQPGRNSNFFDFPGATPEVDRIISRMLGDASVQSLLSRCLGEGYRIWYAQFRRVEVASPAGSLHQDLPGEVGMSILLSETPGLEGTTAFVPNSHRWPRLLSSFRFLNTKRSSRFLKGSSGSPGDAYLFYSRTWHGATATDNQARTAIILTFIPKDAKAGERVADEELLARVPAELSRALSGKTQAPHGTPSGPDANVQENISIPIWHPWRILMGSAWCYDQAIRVYRKLKSQRH